MGLENPERLFGAFLASGRAPSFSKLTEPQSGFLKRGPANGVSAFWFFENETEEKRKETEENRKKTRKKGRKRKEKRKKTERKQGENGKKTRKKKTERKQGKKNGKKTSKQHRSGGALSLSET